MSYFYRAQAWAGVLDKNNVLELAARGGHTRTVRALLDAGADIHTGDDEPLRIAAWWGRADTVRALLESGADVHARHDEALRWAAKEKHLETVKVLEDWIAQHPQGVPSAPQPT
jgi:ankyrin repeat protein